MTFQQLTYVVEISKCGSINKAAHKLFLSQSGISAAVRELEEDSTELLRSPVGEMSLAPALTISSTSTSPAAKAAR